MRVLLRLSSPLSPTPAQVRRLDRLMAAARGIEVALRHVGGDVSRLPGALARTAAGEELTVPAGGAGSSGITAGQLQAALPSVWADIPLPVLRGVLRRCRARPEPGAATLVDLDEALTVVDDFHVHIAGESTLLVGDHWRQPLGLAAAVQATGQARIRRVAEELEAAQRADAAGQAWALRTLHDLARQHGPLLGRAGPEAPPLGGVQCVYASLREYPRDDAPSQWYVTWTYRVPRDWLPPATRRDVVGVDVGVKHLLSWAAAHGSGSVPALALPTGMWTPPGGVSTPLAAAVVRRAQFARRATEIDAALRTLLTFQTIAIEATRWANLADKREFESMQLSGVTELRHWLQELAPVTGSRVLPVSAWHGSHRCGACGAGGTRSGRRFTCPACGAELDADLNAARWYRQLGLAA